MGSMETIELEPSAKLTLIDVARAAGKIICNRLDLVMTSFAEASGANLEKRDWDLLQAGPLSFSEALRMEQNSRTTQ